MINGLFTGLFNNTGIYLTGFLVCFIIAAALGAIISLIHSGCADSSKGYNLTLALIPPIVCVVIMMVSGSLGACIAVAGTFSLVRFRSAQGSAQEIGSLFLAVAAGIACGMGYPGFAVLFCVILCILMLFYSKSGFGARRKNTLSRLLNITVPEDVSYTHMFDDIFEKYTVKVSLTRIKTTNLGSLIRLSYDLVLRNDDTEEDFINALRVRNGNLEVGLTFGPDKYGEL